MITPIAPAADPAAVRDRLGLRWWKEALYILAFYLIYSAIRNQFGSAAVAPAVALDNALRVIDVERFLGLYFEEAVQGWFVTAVRGGYEFAFVGARQIMQFWNVFYGTLHFLVTGFALVWLFRRFPADYPTWRNTLAFTTGLALIGFSVFPLMPPRLLTDCGAFGACLESFSYVDSLADIGGLWSFDSGAMQSVSNQYAAMPSLHFAWSAWSFLVLFPRVRHRWARVLVSLYPLLTLWAIVVTANHFWLDAVGGALVLAAGYAIGSTLARTTDRYRLARSAAAHHGSPSEAPADE